MFLEQKTWSVSELGLYFKMSLSESSVFPIKTCGMWPRSGNG